MSNQQDMPLFSALLEFDKKSPISFHVPGHKNGTIMPLEMKQWFHPLLRFDMTELTGLDDLHDAKGAIAKAEQLTASLYNVRRSFFLINGSTVGNLAMILATCQEGDIVLVQRNCHKSIMNGIKLAKAVPVFIEPMFDIDLQLYTGLNDEAVKHAIDLYPDAKALILTTPSYYGIASSIKAIVDIAHQNGIPVLVDEAHGAHFIIGSPFPTSAIQQGADIVVHSAHKTLPAMTMASYLHFNSSLISSERLQTMLTMLQSSSPSYPLMLSLDIARYYLAGIDEKKKTDMIQSFTVFRNKLAEIEQIFVVKPDKDEIEFDPLKVIVETRCSLNGFALQKELEKAGIFTELADEHRVLLVLGLAPLVHIDQLIERIKDAIGSFPIVEPRNYPPLYVSSLTTLNLTYKEMEQCKTENISILKAVGRVAATNIVPYPPGIPLLLAGQEISQTHVEEIIRLSNAGVTFQGNQSILHDGIDVFIYEKRGK